MFLKSAFAALIKVRPKTIILWLSGKDQPNFIYNSCMPEKEDALDTTLLGSFTETGINSDVLNAWLHNSMLASMESFSKLERVEHYDEYFRRKLGSPEDDKLLHVIIRRSNPETVTAFNQLVVYLIGGKSPRDDQEK